MKHELTATVKIIVDSDDPRINADPVKYARTLLMHSLGYGNRSFSVKRIILKKKVK